MSLQGLWPPLQKAKKALGRYAPRLKPRAYPGAHGRRGARTHHPWTEGRGEGWEKPGGLEGGGSRAASAASAASLGTLRKGSIDSDVLMYALTAVVQKARRDTLQAAPRRDRDATIARSLSRQARSVIPEASAPPPTDRPSPTRGGGGAGGHR